MVAEASGLSTRFQCYNEQNVASANQGANRSLVTVWKTYRANISLFDWVSAVRQHGKTVKAKPFRLPTCLPSNSYLLISTHYTKSMDLQLPKVPENSSFSAVLRKQSWSYIYKTIIDFVLKSVPDFAVMSLESDQTRRWCLFCMQNRRQV